MNTIGDINKSKSKTKEAQRYKVSQEIQDDKEDDALLGQKNLSANNKIKFKRYLNTTVNSGLIALVFFLVAFVIIILGVGVINFVAPESWRWLEIERMNEIKAFLTGGAGALGASVLADKLRDKE